MINKGDIEQRVKAYGKSRKSKRAHLIVFQNALSQTQVNVEYGGRSIKVSINSVLDFKILHIMC